MKKIIVVGGGAAGMMAAIAAAEAGASVTILERNEKLGKKIYITGKGRCNVTNACEKEDLIRNVVSNPRFLYSAFHCFDNRDMMEFLEENGCRLKVERGNRVFPVSDHASDVTKALERVLKRLGVEIRLNTRVRKILTYEEPYEPGIQKILGVELGKETLTADAVILATGGASYPSTGSDGSGYAMAHELGLQLTDCRPALVPMVTKEQVGELLQGLSLRNIEAAIYDGKKEIYREFGEMLFTHFGVSGPVILSASSYVGEKLKKNPLKLVIDLKPALTEEELDGRILRDFTEAKNKDFQNALGKLFPAKLIPVIVARSGIPEHKKVNIISKTERLRLVQVTKHLEFTLMSLRGFNEAIITQGGISVKEFNPKTMESKNIPGLYAAGEVLDVDAVTGGFNLQTAWSTGYLAGKCAAGGLP